MKFVPIVLSALLLGGGAAAVALPAVAEAATCTTSSVSGNCGPYEDPAVFRTDNAVDLVSQNDFSAIPQTLSATDSANWTVTANAAAQRDQTSVKSYPATQVTYTTTANKPEPVATFGSTLTSDYTNIEPSGSGQDYEYAVDDWLANPNQPSWTNDFEMMVWTDTHGQVPAGNDTGNVYTDAAGVKWEVWVNHGSTTVSSNADIVSFVRQTNSVSGSLDRIGFYNYLVSQGYLNTANFGIDQLNYGLEICATGSGAKTYGVSGYTLVSNGAVPTPTPTSPSPTPTPTQTTPSPSPTPTGPAVSFVASAGAKKARASSLSYTVNAGTDANRELVAEATLGVQRDQNCSLTVTDNGVPMAKLAVVHTNNQHDGYMNVWALADPPAGVNTIAVHASGCSGGIPKELTSGAESFAGAGQVSVTTAFGAGDTASAPATAADGNTAAVFAAAGSGLRAANAPAVNRFLENVDNQTGAGNSAGATLANMNGSVTFPITATDWWAVAVVQLQHV